MFHDLRPGFLDVSLIFFAAGAIKGVLGMGLPTAAMGLLGLVMPVASAASLMMAPSLVTNIWQAAVGPSFARTVRRLWPMLAAIVAGVALAPLLFPQQHEGPARLLLGVCLAAYGASGLLGWRPRPSPARWQPAAGLLAGATTGLITGLTGVFVLPAVPYLQSIGLGKEDLPQALGLSFTTSTLALAAMLALQGHLDAGTSTASAIAVIPAVLGMVAGQIIRRKLSEAVFRRCFFTGLVAIGLGLLAR